MVLSSFEECDYDNYNKVSLTDAQQIGTVMAAMNARSPPLVGMNPMSRDGNLGSVLKDRSQFKHKTQERYPRIIECLATLQTQIYL
jgi:hypothetical protein